MAEKQIKDIIYENRKRLGLTQEQLAERLNVSNKTVSKWETGKSYPDVLLVSALAGELGISINQFFDLEADAAEPEIREEREEASESAACSINEEILRCRLGVIFAILLLVFSPVVVILLWMLNSLAAIIVAIFAASLFILSSLTLLVVNTVKMREYVQDGKGRREGVTKYITVYLIYALIWYVYLMLLSPVAMAVFDFEAAMMIMALAVHILFCVIPVLAKKSFNVKVKSRKSLILLIANAAFVISAALLFAFSRVAPLYVILTLTLLQIICYVVDLIVKEDI